MKKPLLIVGGLAALLVLGIVAIVGIQLIRSDDPDLATEAPRLATPTGQGQAPAAGQTATPQATAALATNATAEGLRSFVIVPAESEAKYVVRESLRGIMTNAVGTTREIVGVIHLTEDGLYDGDVSSFRVNLDTLRSDESMRDSYIKRTTLQTDRFPYAEFVAESITGFPSGYVEDDEVQLTLSGILTIRDVSQPVTWTVLARQLGDSLSAVADLHITFQDFGMTPPSVAIATAEDEIHLQVVLIAREQ